jgi:Anaerobic ribonucleoside-triphosphate reductase
MACSKKTEVYSRIVGYYRPVQQWNKGKQAEYERRKEYLFQHAVFQKMQPADCKDAPVACQKAV